MIEDKAVSAFQMRLNESSVFIQQAADRKDYGTDCQTEVIAGGHATNARVHVQLKRTGSALNADGSLCARPAVAALYLSAFSAAESMPPAHAFLDGIVWSHVENKVPMILRSQRQYRAIPGAPQLVGPE